MVSSSLTKLGFRRAIVPQLNKPKQEIENMEVTAVRTIAEALEAARG